jgi:hypothetical protein
MYSLTDANSIAFTSRNEEFFSVDVFYVWIGVVQSVVSDYRLDDWGSIPGRGRGFFLLACVQTGTEAHPASYPMSTGGLFPGGKARPGRDADHSRYLVQRSRMSRSNCFQFRGKARMHWALELFIWRSAISVTAIRTSSSTRTLTGSKRPPYVKWSDNRSGLHQRSLFCYSGTVPSIGTPSFA